MWKDNGVRDAAIEMGKLLRDHRGGEVLVLDLRESLGWTDFFVIATVTSATHLQGLERHIKEFSQEKGLEILRVSSRPKAAAEDTWVVMDLGTLVIHLMTPQIRGFYELERLWSAAAVIFEEK